MDITSLLPGLFKGVTSAIGKISGASISSWWQRRSLLSAIESIEPPAEFSWEARIDHLSATQITRLAKFCDSPEFAAVSLRVVASQIKSTKKKKSIESRNALVREVDELLLLLCDISDTTLAEALVEQVSHESAKVLSNPQVLQYLPKRSLAEIIDLNLDEPTSRRRNADIIASIHNVDEVNEFEDLMRSQVRNVYSKMRLPHVGARQPIPYSELYVAPNLTTQSSKQDSDNEWVDLDVTLKQVFSTSMRAIILGDPGGGKSTLSYKTLVDIAGTQDDAPTRATLPLLVVLRDYAQAFESRNISILSWIEESCSARYQVDPPAEAIEYCLLNGRAFIVFDGLDELINVNLREQIVQAVHAFVHRFPDVQVLVTSRRIGYEQAPLDESLFETLQLGEFDERKVSQYATNWFKVADTIEEHQRESITESFLAESKLVSDLRANPLMLSLMCSIYCIERYIPRNRPDVYEQCATMLFERWDSHRDIKVPLPFDAHVRNSMYALALWLYKRDTAQEGLSKQELTQFITTYLLEKRFDQREEAENAAENFVDFCTGRAWVMTDVGSNPSQPLYGFTHRTFLEYFAAKQLVRTNTSGSLLFEVIKGPISRAEWDVVCQLAIQILSASVEDGADDLLDLLVEHAKFLHTVQKLNIASFLARALEFIIPRPQTLRSTIDFCFETFQITDDSADEGSARNVEIAGRLLNPAKEISDQVYTRVRELIALSIREEPCTPALALGCYPHQYLLRGAPLYANAADTLNKCRDLAKSLESLTLTAASNFIAPDRPTWISAFLVRNRALRIGDLNGPEKVKVLLSPEIVHGITVSPVALAASVSIVLMNRDQSTDQEDPNIEASILASGSLIETSSDQHWICDLHGALLSLPLPWGSSDIILPQYTWHSRSGLHKDFHCGDSLRNGIVVMMAAFASELFGSFGDFPDASPEKIRGLECTRYLHFLGFDDDEIQPLPKDQAKRNIGLWNIQPAVKELLTQWVNAEVDLMAKSHV